MLAADLLNALADRIEQALPEIRSKRNEKTLKNDGSYVTAGDLFVDGLTHAFFKTNIPHATIISEETFTEFTGLCGTTIIVDPIDGTENFVSGLREWGVGISVWQGSQHVASMLHLPEMHCRMLTGQPVPCFESRITGLSSSINDGIRAALTEPGEFRMMGCAVYNFYNVISGSYARFINPKGAYVWDLVPGLMLALEHGCEVLVDDRGYDGQFLDPTCRYRVDVRHRHNLHLRQGSVD